MSFVIVNVINVRKRRTNGYHEQSLEIASRFIKAYFRNQRRYGDTAADGNCATFYQNASDARPRLAIPMFASVRFAATACYYNYAPLTLDLWVYQVLLNRYYCSCGREMALYAVKCAVTLSSTTLRRRYVKRTGSL